MSTNSFWQDVKSQIPILKSGRYEPKEKKIETTGRKWNEKLKKRSSSALSIFQVTHKVPSHIVSPKSSKEADSQFQNWKESRQYNSNIELSKCLDSVDEMTTKNGIGRPSHKRYHGSAQDLTMAWWQKKPPTTSSTTSNVLCDLKEKSASISNIFNEKESNDSSVFFPNNEAPKSFSGVQAYENVGSSYQDIPRNVNFPYQPAPTSNKGMRKQFLSEQNLFDTSSEPGYGLHSLDHCYPYKGAYNKINFDISTIKELPEDRSDSPVRQLDDDASDREIFDLERNTCLSLPPSYVDTYRSLQNLCMDVSGTQQHANLNENNIGNHVTYAPSNHGYKPSEVDGNCFRSIQDLRDSSVLEDTSLFSMDYKSMKSNLHSSTTKLLNENAKPGDAEKTCFDYWVDNDRSVSMLDITEIGAYRKDFSRRNSSRIPKRRHTVSAHNLDGLSLNTTSGAEPSSKSKTAPQPDCKGSGKSLTSPELGARVKNSNSSSIATKSSCCKKAPTLERKSGCVGCQRKRHQVARQNSMPLLKNGAMRDKTGDGRKPLNRSCSNPGPPNRKLQVQEKQQKKVAQMNEKHNNYTNERSEVDRLREEIHTHKRTIRQLSMRLPRESYMDNQPLSLGHIPSSSVDNVFDAFLRPCRARQDTTETTELRELVGELRAENGNLRSELQEARDQAELLEFRVLELTEGSDRFSEADKATCSRDAEEKAEPQQTLNFEDLSLPLSIDSGLDLTADGKRARCCAVEPALQAKSEDAESATCLPAPQSECSGDSEKSEDFSSSSEKTSFAQTNENESDSVKFDDGNQDVSKPTDTVELPEVISNLQHYLGRPDQLQAALLAAVQKLQSLNSSVSDFEAQVSTMTRENQYLAETLSSLNEAQETRTEASGTESEIVSRKTPSPHSDLSDSDSDSSAADNTLAKKRFETLSSFQESGIFEGSSDVHHTATQTEDDGEAAAAAGEKEELEMENSRLREALDELRRNYDQLLQNRDKCPRCLEGLEVDRGESRALKEQLRVSQGARKALYEEKCELEEAENDARLMVQRLDSQLTAAREMELLLSASLSQEQEISRELHKKVKELQYLQAAEKERCFRQNLLEKENIDDRVVNLVLDKDTYMSQLEFVKHSLILLQVFRHFYLLNTWLSAADGCQAPTDGLEAVDEYVRGSQVVEATDDGCFKERQNESHIENRLIEITPDPIVSSQSTLKYPVDSEINFSSTFLSLDEMIEQHPKFPEFLMPGFADISVQTEPVNLCAEVLDAANSPENFCSHQPGNFRAFSSRTGDIEKVEVQTKSTMTVEKDLLSLRESFYLEQIETLQEEKSVLRKEFGQERSVAVEREALLQETVQELQAQLGASERAQADLQCEIELLKEKEETLSKDFHKFMEQSRNDRARCSEHHEREKAAMRRDFDARLAEVAAECRRQSDRSAELEHQLSALWRELEVAGMGALAEYEGKSPPAAAPSQGDSEAPSQPGDVLRLSCTSDLLDAVRRLVKSENSLRAKISELEKKESAYRETIQEADQIMLSHVTSYKQRIDELEAANEQSAARVRLLESGEERLRSSLKSSARCDHDARVAELLEQLLSIEKSELELKHKLWNFERNEKELKIKVIEGEKMQESLRAELRDQDDLVRKMHNLQAENSAIAQQLQRAHESVRRAVDKQQTESLLKGRVEELECSETALKNTLQQTYSAHALKERRLNQQVAALEEEAASLKKRLASASEKEAQTQASELALRRHLEALRSELEDAKRDLKVFSADESSSRTEVSRLRSQLKQANGELTEAENINCNLRERLAAAEQLRETLERSLEERKRRHESELLQLNLQVSQRESRLEETEGQLCELTQLHAAHELDFLASSPLEPVMRAARRLTAQLSLCDACAQSHGAAIEDLSLQLDTLTDLLSGAPPQDETDGEEYGDQPAESFEKMKRINSGTPASGAHRGDSAARSPSEEGCYSSASLEVSSAVKEINSEPSEASPQTSPAPVPAPRRKRKLKRDFASSLRSSLKNRKKGGSTILEELEEKVRELEESVSSKDEELRLADSEATDLSSKLAAAQEIALTKEAEIAIIRQTMTELQRQLTSNMENNETTRRNFESKYKEARDRMEERAQQLALQLEEITARGRAKDCIISTLARHTRSFLKSRSINVIIVQVNRLREEMEQRIQRSEKKEWLHTESTADAEKILQNEIDHDVRSVCELLARPLEVATRPLDGPASEDHFPHHTEPSAVQTHEDGAAPMMVHKEIQTVMNSCSLQELPMPVISSSSKDESVAQLDLTTEECIHRNSSFNNSITEAPVSHSVDNSCCLVNENAVESNNLRENICLTLIHKSTQTSPSHFQKIGPRQKSFIPKIVKPHNTHLKSEGHSTILSKSNSESLSLVREVEVAPHRSRTKMCQRNLGPPLLPAPETNKRRTETGTTIQRATVQPSNELASVALPSAMDPPTLRAAGKSSPQTEEKGCNLPVQTSRSLQPPTRAIHHSSRKLRVNVTARERPKPAWESVGRIARNSSAALNSGCEANNIKLIPRPTNLKITRWVGKDGVVIAWELQNHDGVAGFQVIVAGKVIQSVRSAKRTKALITGLPSASSVSVGLVSVSSDGRCSKPAVVTCDRPSTSLK